MKAYRLEIDGLRALAVIPVILFHAGFDAMSGGFVGVDVFFVISGYLITSILIEEIKNDHFSIIDFYERRARRILPPLFAVTLVTTPAVFLLLSPEAIVDYGKSLLSLSVFASNVYFALTGGYFANNVVAKPLLHTWSLSVEEQFYLFFPLLMLVWKSQSKNAQLSIISLLSLISFLISVVLVTMYPRIAFFGIPSRAWELGIGAVIATLMVQNKIPPPFLKAPLAFIGLAGLLISYFVINPSDMMPGVIALLPVLSTALIIMCADHESSVAKILSHKYLVLIGLMSYSLYLWHQPVLALYKDIIEPHPTALSIAIILVLIFILSYLSWKFVEQPFRNKSRVGQKQIFVLSAIGLIFTATLGAVSILNNGFIHRFPAYKAVKQTLAWPDELNKCDDCSRKYGNNQYCLIYDSTNEPTDILIGDSHANHFFLGLSAELGKTDRNLLMIGAGGCPPLIDIDMGYNLDHGGKLQCMKRTNALYKRLLSCKTADRIFLAFSENTLFDLTLDFTDSRGEIDFSIDRENAVRLALMRTVELAANNGKTVYIIEDLPDTTFPDFEKSLLRSNDYTSSLHALKMKSNNQQYQALLSYLQEHGIRVLRTHHLLYRFPFTDREQLLYRDGTHLSREGSRFVGEGMALQLRTKKMMTGR